MILVYVLLGIISLIILLIFYLRHKSFKINPEDGWIKIKSSNRFYKAYLIHEKPTAGRVVLFLHGWNGNDKTWKKETELFTSQDILFNQLNSLSPKEFKTVFLYQHFFE